jgi:hypothetical protein
LIFFGRSEGEGKEGEWGFQTRPISYLGLFMFW